MFNFQGISCTVMGTPDAGRFASLKNGQI